MRYVPRRPCRSPRGKSRGGGGAARPSSPARAAGRAGGPEERREGAEEISPHGANPGASDSRGGFSLGLWGQRKRVFGARERYLGYMECARPSVNIDTGRWGERGGTTCGRCH